MWARALQIGFELLNLKETVGGFEKIARTIERADESVKGIAQTIRSTGGTAEQAGSISGLSRLSGHNPGEAGAQARGLRETLAGNPLAQGTFGTGVLPTRTGQLVNEAQLYERIARQIIFARTDEEARIKAQIAGMEDLLPLRDADERITRRALATAAERGRMVDRDLRRERQNVEQLRHLREENGERLRLWVEKLFAVPRTKIETIKAGFGQLAADAVTGQGLDKYRFHQNPFLVAKGNQTTSPADKNTAAMENLTQELVALRKEWMNDRGGRAAGAVPRSLRGKALDRYLEHAARDLGAVAF